MFGQKPMFYQSIKALPVVNFLLEMEKTVSLKKLIFDVVLCKSAKCFEGEACSTYVVLK